MILEQLRLVEPTVELESAYQGYYQEFLDASEGPNWTAQRS